MKKRHLKKLLKQLDWSYDPIFLIENMQYYSRFKNRHGVIAEWKCNKEIEQDWEYERTQYFNMCFPLGSY